MKLLSGFVFAIAAFGQGLHVDIPFHAVRHPLTAIRSAKGFLTVTDIALQLTNGLDYYTTRRGAFPGTGGCELNSLFASNCRINVAAFTGVKAALALVGIGEWIPVWTGRASANYMAVAGTVNLGLAIPLGIGDVNNFSQLEKEGK